MNVVLIPARAGSKGVPRKNIKRLGGFPLVAYSIAAAKLSSTIHQIIVSTDSNEIATLCRNYGAETPFLRPAEISGDLSTNLEFVQHYLKYAKDFNMEIPDLIVQLSPPTPLRDPHLIDAAVKMFKRDIAFWTSLRSAHELSEPPHKMMRVEKDGSLTGFFPFDPRPEYFNLPRQMFSKAYHPDGYVDIFRPDVVMSGLLFGDKIMPFITKHVTEIDSPDDFEYLEYVIEKRGHPLLDYLKSNFERYRHAQYQI